MTQNALYVLQLSSVYMFELDTVKVFPGGIEFDNNHSLFQEFSDEIVKDGYSYIAANLVSLCDEKIVLRGACTATGKVKRDYYG